MVALYGESSPSCFQVKNLSKQFKWGEDSIQDDAKSRRPLEARSREVLTKLKIGVHTPPSKSFNYFYFNGNIRKEC